MNCRYCGLDTGSGGSHASLNECIGALMLEVERLRQALASKETPDGKRESPGAPRSTPEDKVRK